MYYDKLQMQSTHSITYYLLLTHATVGCFCQLHHFLYQLPLAKATRAGRDFVAKKLNICLCFHVWL